MMVDIVEVRPLGGYRVHLRFADGLQGELDLAEVISFEGVFAPLRDPVKFAEIRVHQELGTVAWPNTSRRAPS